MFKHLSEDEIEKIAREVATSATIRPTTASTCSRSSTRCGAPSEYVTRGGVEYAQKLLIRTLGADIGAPRFSIASSSRSSRRPAFSTLERADPQQLSKFILAEHPQTIALILAHLNAGQCGAARHAAAR